MENDKTYYCHRCEHFVKVIPDFQCNNCFSQFVEEIDDDNGLLESVLDIGDSESTTAMQSERDLTLHAHTSLNRPNHREERQHVPQSTRRRPRSRSEEFHVSSAHHFSLMHGLSIPFGIMNALNITDLNESFGVSADTLVVNAGDLLSNILTQIFSSHGSMPMSQRSIDRLERVTIDERHIEQRLFCTICIENFKLNECARKLSCDHFFHYNCIAPWLSLHANCPVCRKEFTNCE